MATPFQQTQEELRIVRDVLALATLDHVGDLCEEYGRDEASKLFAKSNSMTVDQRDAKARELSRIALLTLHKFVTEKVRHPTV